MKLFSMIVLLSLCMVVPVEDSWELKRNKQGIKVYTRSVAGSSFKEFKAIAELETTPATIVAVVKDIENLKNWMPNTKVAKQLSKISPTKEMRYVELSAPWPVTNRDMISLFHFTYNKTSKAVKIAVTAKPNYQPKKKGIVRIPAGKGFYLITPKANGKVEFKYQFHSETGGNIPGWLANSSVVEIPFKTVVNLRKEVKKTKYQNKTFTFMK